jgi:adenylate cyclase
MPRNIEIKARVESIAAIEPLAAALATQGPQDLRQDDSFFRCAQGRLKLRTFADGSGELIAYQRADEAGPKTSTYVRTPAADSAGLRDALAAACGLAGRVRKHRRLYLAGRTRIHLDEVEGLGAFLELEVVLADDEPVEAGMAEALALMARLGVDSTALVEGAYLDLLASGPSPAG